MLGKREKRRERACDVRHEPQGSVQESSSTPTLIYIVCRGHSGSTMLELLLNRSPRIAAMGEVDVLPLQIYRDHRTRWVGQCSCLARPMDCPVWGEVISEIQSSYGVDLVKRPFAKRFSNTGLEEEYGLMRPYAWLTHQVHSFTRLFLSGRPLGGTYADWVECRDLIASKVARIQHVDAVVDASKDPLEAIDLVRYSRLPVKLLYLTRDVRGLAWSAVKNGRSTAVREARDWVKLNQRILNLLSKVSRADWLQVKYEELCSNTEHELSRIHEFIGIPRLAVTVEEEKRRRHTIAGNVVRFHPLQTIREDIRWQEHLSKSDLGKVAQTAASIANRLGYNLNDA